MSNNLKCLPVENKNLLGSKFLEKTKEVKAILEDLFPENSNQKEKSSKIQNVQKEHVWKALKICSDLWKKIREESQKFSKEINRLLEKKWVNIEELSIKSNIKQDALKMILSQNGHSIDLLDRNLLNILAYYLDTNILEIYKNAGIQDDSIDWEYETIIQWFTNKEYGKHLYKDFLKKMRQLEVGSIINREINEKEFWYIRDFNQLLKEIYSEEIESELKNANLLKDFDYLKHEKDVSYNQEVLERKIQKNKDILSKLNSLKEALLNWDFTDSEKKEIIKWYMLGIGNVPTTLINFQKEQDNFAYNNLRIELKWN